MSFIFSSDDPPSDEDGSMFGPKAGSWWLVSKKDPRFNLSGSARVGGFVMPAEAREAMNAKAKELGCPIPDDLEFNYMKD